MQMHVLSFLRLSSVVELKMINKVREGPLSCIEVICLNTLFHCIHSLFKVTLIKVESIL